jgi:hypothetical protein
MKEHDCTCSGEEDIWAIDGASWSPGAPLGFCKLPVSPIQGARVRASRRTTCHSAAASEPICPFSAALSFGVLIRSRAQRELGHDHGCTEPPTFLFIRHLKGTQLRALSLLPQSHV